MSILDIAKKLNRKADLFITKNGTKDFHRFAADQLAQTELHKNFDIQEIFQANFAEGSEDIQNYKFLEFSDLPLTLTRGKNCFIDIYFWRRRPTTIHNHHFSGAFMCLTGFNVDLEFTFKKIKKIGKFHELGTLELKKERMMKAGDISEINFMDKFIHQNHHQSDLTANLTFRTNDVPKKYLSNFLYSGLKFEKSSILLNKVARLRKFIDIGQIDVKKIKVSDDEALCFLLQNFGSTSENPQFIALMKDLVERLKKTHGINFPKLIAEHDLRLDNLENEYQ